MKIEKIVVNCDGFEIAGLEWGTEYDAQQFAYLVKGMFEMVKELRKDED